MNKIAIFFDIDGTLFDSKTKSVLPKTKYVLENFKNNPNIDIYLSTGRSYETLGSIKAYEDYFNGMNLSNGQEILIDNNKVYGEALNVDVLKRLFDTSVKRQNSLGIILKDEIVMNFITEESYKNFTTFIKKEVKNLDYAPFDFSKEVIQIWIFATNEELELYKKEFPELSFLNWGNYGADIIPSGASKARGIKHIQSLKGYKFENMYAIGDGDNDVEMFKVVKTSIAMGNGSTKAKESATFITDDISNDGLYKAFKKINLI